MVDFTKLNKISKNQTMKTNNGNDTTHSKMISSYSPLQHKVDLNQKKMNFIEKFMKNHKQLEAKYKHICQL